MTDEIPNAAANPASVPPPKRRVWLWVLGVLFGLFLIVATTVFVTGWYIKKQFDPDPIEPTTLSQVEQQNLDAKIENLEAHASRHADGATTGGGVTIPQPDEAPVRKEVSITQKELNAILAHNTDLADKVELLLTDDTLGARTNIPIPPDFPMFGGKTVRLRLSLSALLIDGQLALTVRDISLAGFPLPNAWLGGIKNVDLVKEYAHTKVMRAFVAGLEDFRIEDGAIYVTPAE